jgi:ribosomal protein L7/L12
MRDVPLGVREALEQGETILAIKRFREATGAGLKEAKDFVDEVRRRQAATS